MKTMQFTPLNLAFVLGLLSFYLLSPKNLYAQSSSHEGNTIPSEILYIGDSHSSGQFGQSMYEKLSSIAPTTLMSSCGSTPKSWFGTKQYQRTICGFWHKDATTDTKSKNLQTPHFLKLLETHKPKLTIIQLGTNMAAFENPSIFTESIRNIMQATEQSGSACIWIGAPSAKSKRVSKKNIEATDAMLAKLAEENSCYFIKSSDITVYPNSKNNSKKYDGIHYPSPEAKLWAENVMTRMDSIFRELGINSVRSKYIEE